MQRNGVALPLLGALAAAVIGGALWALIAVLTNYEIGLVAWAIGGMAAYAVVFLSKRQITQAHQIIAVAASLIGILLGKYFIFGYMLNDGANGMFDSETLQLFQDNFSILFGGVDIVFILLAVATAWQLPNRLANKNVETDMNTETTSQTAE